MFHKEGQNIILTTFFIVVILILVAQYYIDIEWLKWALQIGALVILVLILQFFRNPKRNAILNFDGVVTYSKYHPGKYLVAWHPKSSTDNERTSVVVRTPKFGEILYRQIAGAMARRIVNYAEEGDNVQQGDDAGFIKFGSRVDLFLPLDCSVTVELNQKVVGAKTCIAAIPDKRVNEE